MVKGVEEMNVPPAEIELVVRLRGREGEVDVGEHLWRTAALEHDTLKLGLRCASAEQSADQKGNGLGSHGVSFWVAALHR